MLFPDFNVLIELRESVSITTLSGLFSLTHFKPSMIATSSAEKMERSPPLLKAPGNLKFWDYKCAPYYSLISVFTAVSEYVEMVMITATNKIGYLAFNRCDSISFLFIVGLTVSLGSIPSRAQFCAYTGS